jgi:hypothetical protein
LPAYAPGFIARADTRERDRLGALGAREGRRAGEKPERARGCRTAGKYVEQASGAARAPAKARKRARRPARVCDSVRGAQSLEKRRAAMGGAWSDREWRVDSRARGFGFLPAIFRNFATGYWYITQVFLPSTVRHSYDKDEKGSWH